MVIINTMGATITAGGVGSFIAMTLVSYFVIWLIARMGGWRPKRLWMIVGAVFLGLIFQVGVNLTS